MEQMEHVANMLQRKMNVNELLPEPAGQLSPQSLDHQLHNSPPPLFLKSNVNKAANKTATNPPLIYP